MNDKAINQKNLQNLLAHAHLQSAQKRLVTGIDDSIDPKYRGELGQDYQALEDALITLSAKGTAGTFAAGHIRTTHQSAIAKVNQSIAGSNVAGVIAELKDDLTDKDDLSKDGKDEADISIIELLKRKHREAFKKVLDGKSGNVSEKDIHDIITAQNKAYFDEIHEIILKNHYDIKQSLKDQLIETLKKDPEYAVIWADIDLNTKVEEGSVGKDRGANAPAIDDLPTKKKKRFLAAVQESYLKRKLITQDKKGAEKAGKLGRFLFPFTCGFTTWGFTFLLFEPLITPFGAFLLGAFLGWINAHVNYWVSTNAGTNAWIAMFVDEYLRLTPWKKRWKEFTWSKLFSFRIITVIAALASMIIWGVAAGFALFEIGSKGMEALLGDLLPAGLSFHLYSDAFWVVMSFAIPFGIATGLSFAFLCLEAGKKYDHDIWGKLKGHYNDIVRTSKINNKSVAVNCALFALFVVGALTGLFFTAYASFDPIVGMLAEAGMGKSHSYFLTLGMTVTGFWGAIHFYGNGAINSIKRFIRWRSEDTNAYEELEKTRQFHNQGEDADPLGLDGPEYGDIVDKYQYDQSSWISRVLNFFNPWTRSHPLTKHHQQKAVLSNAAANMPITIIGAITAGISVAFGAALGLLAAVASYAANNRGVVKQKSHEVELQEATENHSTVVGEFNEGVKQGLEDYIEKRGTEDEGFSGQNYNSKENKLAVAQNLLDGEFGTFRVNASTQAMLRPSESGRLGLLNKNVVEMKEYVKRNTVSA